MSSATCKTCGAAVVLLPRLISGAAVACDPASVRPGDGVFVPSLHREHVCPEKPAEPSRQRGLFGEEE